MLGLLIFMALIITVCLTAAITALARLLTDLIVGSRRRNHLRERWP